MSGANIHLLFPFDTAVSGDYFLGRRSETEALVQALSGDGRGAVLYEPPKSGKETLIRHAIQIMGGDSGRLILCEADLGGVRDYKSFIATLRGAFGKAFEDISRHTLLPFEIDVEKIDEKRLLTLPHVMAAQCGVPVILYLREFQNIANAAGKHFRLEDLDKEWTRQKGVKYIFSGSCVNAMKEIFEEKMLFYYLARHIALSPLPKREVVEHLSAKMLGAGRVLQSEEAEEIWRLCCGSIWYARQLCTICYSYPAGYINHSVVESGHRALMSLHRPRFLNMAAELTPHQISLLRAICDGEQRFSSAEVIARYGLNSSANVFRLKEALRKKEIVTFDRKDKATILDPLFEYWLKKEYFPGV